MSKPSFGLSQRGQCLFVTKNYMHCLSGGALLLLMSS